MEHSDYVAGLPVSDELKTELRAFGAESPLALLELIRASRSDFTSHFGPSTTELLEDELANLIPAEVLKELELVPDVPMPMGALLNMGFELPAPPFDIEERDKLYFHIEGLRAMEHPTDEQQIKLDQLETELIRLLEEPYRKEA